MIVSVVAPWFGNTSALIPDFLKAVTGVDELVIVDDGVDKRTAEELRIACTRGAGDIFIQNEQNLGFAGACNVGYAVSTGDVVCFLNSDVSGQPRRLAKALEREVPKDAIVGPALGQQWAFATPFAYIDGWCVAARRETWERLIIRPTNVGPWDAERYPTPYFEDVDLSLRAVLADVRLDYRHWSSFLKHKAGQSMGFSPAWGESYERNRRAFLERAQPAWEQLLRNRGEVAR